MEKLAPYLWVALGSALGGVGRFWLASLVEQRIGRSFPWGTLLVNITGSLAIGFLATCLESGSRIPPKFQPMVMQLFMAGLCGGYTTFSAFSLQTLQLIQSGQWRPALLYILLSVLLCLLGVWLGHRLGSGMNR